MPRKKPSRSAAAIQDASPSHTNPARAKDVETMAAIIEAMYAIISGPAGRKRDWDRFHSLFFPDAHFILAVARKGETPHARVLDVEGYVRRADPIFKKEGFWEKETGRKTQTFGNIAHVFSKYESRREKTGKPFQRGVNSIQLFHDGTRWWIVSAMWNTERE